MPYSTNLRVLFLLSNSLNISGNFETLTRGSERQLDGEISGHVAQHFRVGDMLSDGGNDGSGVGFGSLLREGDRVTDSELVFEEGTRAAAEQSALTHDADPVAEVVRLVHEVGGQNDDAVVLVGFEQVPDVPPSRGVALSKSQMYLRAEVSIPEVGSSRMMTFDLPANAIATDRRRFWPPDRFLEYSSFFSCRLTSAMSFRTSVASYSPSSPLNAPKSSKCSSTVRSS